MPAEQEIAVTRPPIVPLWPPPPELGAAGRWRAFRARLGAGSHRLELLGLAAGPGLVREQGP